MKTFNNRPAIISGAIPNIWIGDCPDEKINKYHKSFNEA